MPVIKGWKKLTKAQRRHLSRDAGIRCTADFQKTIDDHARMRRDNPEIEPCWDCRIIARKLGMFPSEETAEDTNTDTILKREAEAKAVSNG